MPKVVNAALKANLAYQGLDLGSEAKAIKKLASRLFYFCTVCRYFTTWIVTMAITSTANKTILPANLKRY